MADENQPKTGTSVTVANNADADHIFFDVNNVKQTIKPHTNATFEVSEQFKKTVLDPMVAHKSNRLAYGSPEPQNRPAGEDEEDRINEGSDPNDPGNPDLGPSEEDETAADNATEVRPAADTSRRRRPR